MYKKENIEEVDLNVLGTDLNDMYNTAKMISEQLFLKNPRIVYYSSDKPFTEKDINNKEVTKGYFSIEILKDLLRRAFRSNLVSLEYMYEPVKKLKLNGEKEAYNRNFIIHEKSTEYSDVYYTLRLTELGTDLSINIMFDYVTHVYNNDQLLNIYLGRGTSDLKHLVCQKLALDYAVSTVTHRKTLFNEGDKGLGCTIEEVIDVPTPPYLYNEVSKLIEEQSVLLITSENGVVIMNPEGKNKGVHHFEVSKSSELKTKEEG